MKLDQFERFRAGNRKKLSDISASVRHFSNIMKGCAIEKMVSCGNKDKH